MAFCRSGSRKWIRARAFRAAPYGVVSAFTLLGVAVGRSAILPIVDMVSLCLALSIILCLIILLRRRRHGTPASYIVPGGTPLIVIALLGASAMVGIAILQPFLSGAGRIPPEWLMLGIWAALGMLVWYVGRALQARRATAGLEIFVSIVYCDHK